MRTCLHKHTNTQTNTHRHIQRCAYTFLTHTCAYVVVLTHVYSQTCTHTSVRARAHTHRSIVADGPLLDYHFQGRADPAWSATCTSLLLPLLPSSHYCQTHSRWPRGAPGGNSAWGRLQGDRFPCCPARGTARGTSCASSIQFGTVQGARQPHIAADVGKQLRPRPA